MCRVGGNGANVPVASSNRAKADMDEVTSALKHKWNEEVTTLKDERARLKAENEHFYTQILQMRKKLVNCTCDNNKLAPNSPTWIQENAELPHTSPRSQNAKDATFSTRLHSH